MPSVKNERGLTLLEVLVSTVILMIILVTFMNFFPQMGLMNSKNEEKLQAVNTVKKVLLDWQYDTKKASEVLSNCSNKLGEYCLYETQEDGYKIQLKIKDHSDLNSGPTDAHQIQIQLLDKKDIVVAETYGYIMLN
jgi:type II secretory pathway component PulJ